MSKRHVIALPLAATLLGATVEAGTPATGAWFSPASPGQGLVVEALPGDSAVMFWHGFDASGKAALAYVDGAVDAGRISGQAYLVYGPRFAEFDPADLRFVDAGPVALQITGCGIGEFSAEARNDPGNQLPTAPDGQIQWLATPAGLACTGIPSVTGPLQRMSGTWAHPQLAGQGISVQFLDADNAMVFWHTFDDRGRPRLLLLEAQRDGDQLRGTVYQGGEGAAPGFSAQGATGIRWGEAQIEFVDCYRASLSYQPRQTVASADRSPGTLPLLRLTIPEGVACSDSSALPEGFGRRFEGSLRTGSRTLAADAVLTASDELIIAIAGSGTYRGTLSAGETPQLVLDGYARSSSLRLTASSGELDALLEDEQGDMLGRLRRRRVEDHIEPRSLDGWAGQFGALTLTADGRVAAQERARGILGLDTDLFEGSISLNADGLTFDVDLSVTRIGALGEDRVRYFGAGWFSNDGPRGELRLHQRLRSVDGRQTLNLVWSQ